MQVHIGVMYQDTVIAKDVLRSDLVSAEDREHCAQGRTQLMRTLPKQN